MANKSRSTQNRAMQKKSRDSGQPGGGAGRRDEVGRTPVFPVSASEGASPDARVHGEMSFGQGDRGVAGYEDAGSSEIINFGGTPVSGGPGTGAATVGNWMEVSRPNWVTIFDDFSRLHSGDLAMIEIEGDGRGQANRTKALPFVGVTADLKDGEDMISVILGETPEDNIEHNFPSPTHVWMAKHGEALAIESADGSTARLRFRSAAG